MVEHDERHADRVESIDPAVLLRAAGLRATGARRAVYALLLEHGEPLSHGEVAELLKSSGAWDASTIYRNLQDMEGAGLLRRTELGDRLARFEVLTDEGTHYTQHPHFICTDCGDVTCLPAVSLRFDGPSALPNSIVRSEVEVQIRGRCESCA